MTLLNRCFEEEILRQQKKGADNSERDFSWLRTRNERFHAWLARPGFFFRIVFRESDCCSARSEFVNLSRAQVYDQIFLTLEARALAKNKNKGDILGLIRTKSETKALAWKNAEKGQPGIFPFSTTATVGRRVGRPAPDF